jgi:hypothetical protein
VPELPVPLEFQLDAPPWESVPPASLGVENASFLAVRRGLGDDYSPTISVSGDLRPDAATLEDIAEESLQLLRVQAEDVELVTRQDTGTEQAPSIMQAIGATATIDGRRHDLRQVQVLLSLLDADEPARRAVVILTLSCTFRQFDSVAPEFQAMVASVRPVTGSRPG